MHSTRTYFLDRKLDLPLNSFKTKAAWFCKRCLLNFSLKDNRLIVKLSIELMNSIKCKASLFVKHWMYQTGGGGMCYLRFVMILPLKNISSQTLLMSSSSQIFFAAREGNDSETVDENNSVKSKTTFVGGHTTYLTLNEWVRCDFAEWKTRLNSPHSLLMLWSSLPCSLPIFFTAINSKDPPTVDGKNSGKCRANLLAEHWTHWTPTSDVPASAVCFAEGYKFHSLLGSVGDLSGDKL